MGVETVHKLTHLQQ